MKILLLGPNRESILTYLQETNDKVYQTESKLTVKDFINEQFDFIVCYGYRYIIPKEVIDYYADRIINLHISLLPWNRGADPNLWSFLENTKKGVTIHYIDEGLDTGDIIAQKEIFFDHNETLSSSYEKLTFEIEQLFMGIWPDIRIGKNERRPQSGTGSYHKLKDREKYNHLLLDGWNTKVSNLIGKAQVKE